MIRRAAVYSTDIPLIVAERVRAVTHYDDGTRAERPVLLATWYALRWLIAAFPDCDGFNQRQIAAIAAIDQKMVYKRLRLLYQLDLITECGERHFTNLTGGDGQRKAQRLYSLPHAWLLRIVGMISWCSATNCSKATECPASGKL
jgi:hypothetical protein